MMTLNGFMRSFVSLCLVGLVACTGPTYKTDYYTLEADREATLLLDTAYTGSLGVGPVKLPDMLDHAGIVSRGEAQRVFIAPYDIWAGEIQETIVRVVADNLSMYLGTEEVWPFPWDNRARPERQIRIVLERFGGQRGGEVVLQAKWRLLSSDGSEALHSAKVHLQTEAANNSYNAYVSALNKLLNEFSAVLARVVAEQK